MVSGSHPNVLLYGATHAYSHEIHQLITGRGLSAQFIDHADPGDRARMRQADILVCLLDYRSRTLSDKRVRLLLEQAAEDKIPSLVWGEPHGQRLPEGELIECLPSDVSLDEVIGRLSALARYAPVMKQMDKELQRLQRLGKNLNRYFDEIDQEMRLAGRLQRDFLPRTLPEYPRLRFSQLYRPAVWVSGDIYDAFTVDDRHAAMFIADAMGHGTAAGLMTMFLRRALNASRLNGAEVEIIPPVDVMLALHEELARQDLPHAQFITAAYAVIDHQSLEIRLSRGGHPHPLLVHADGVIEEMRCEGGLLGIAGLEAEFEEYRGLLTPGDKVIFYTDGLEPLFIQDRDGDSEQAVYTENLHGFARHDAVGFAAAVGDYLDSEAGSLYPEDDITILAAEIIA